MAPRNDFLVDERLEHLSICCFLPLAEDCLQGLNSPNLPVSTCTVANIVIVVLEKALGKKRDKMLSV